MALYGIKNEIARVRVPRAHGKRERRCRKATRTGAPAIFSLLSPLLFHLRAILSPEGQQRSITKRKEHLATSYGGAGNRLTRYPRCDFCHGHAIYAIASLIRNEY